MMSRLIALLILTVSILTACGRANATTNPGTAGYLIFLEGGFSNAGESVKVVDSGTGTVVRELPIGTPAAGWSSYYVVTQLTGSAQLKAIDPASGRTIAQTTIPSGYSLPNIAFQGPTAGISPNGQWLALTKSSPSVTNFLVGSSSLGDSFKTIRVNGDFAFDALSNDGQSLYLIQKMKDANHYKVRAHYLDPWQPDTMRLSSDGKWLYVAESSESKLWQIDPATGAVAEFKSVANPWALLWAQPKG